MVAGFIFLGISQSKEGVGLVGMIGLTALGIAILLLATSYVVRCRAIREWHRIQGEAPVSYQVTDDVIRATSNLGATELKWVVFKELSITKEAYLLRYENGAHLTLPIRDVPPDAFSLILEKFRSLRLPIRGVGI